MAIYHDGQWLDDSAMVDSLALTRGVAVFNTLRTLNGQIVFLDQATTRLAEMAQHIDAAADIEEMQTLLKEAVARAYKSKEELSLRIIIAPGFGQHVAQPQTPKPVISIFTEKIPKLNTPELKLMTVPYFRNAAQLKHTNYLPAYVSMKTAKEQGFDNILYTDGQDDPRLIESSTNNVLFVVGTDLVAPRKDIYPGLARELLLKNAHKVGLTPVERDVLRSELPNVKAMFNTGVTYGPRPISKVDTYELQSKTSPHYTELSSLYHELLEESASLA